MLVNSALSGSFNHSDVERKLATANVKEIDDVAKELTGCIPSRVGAFRFVFPKSNSLTTVLKRPPLAKKGTRRHTSMTTFL